MTPPELKYQTFWPRFNAALIDSLLLMAVTHGPKLIWDDWRLIFSDLTANSVFLIYSVTMHGIFGQTLGKMLYKVRIVDVAQERNIGFKRAFIRDLVPLALVLIAWCNMIFMTDGSTENGANSSYSILNSLGIGWLVLELGTALLNKKSRALHDFMAKTVVIKVGDR